MLIGWCVAVELFGGASPHDGCTYPTRDDLLATRTASLPARLVAAVERGVAERRALELDELTACAAMATGALVRSTTYVGRRLARSARDWLIAAGAAHAAAGAERAVVCAAGFDSGTWAELVTAVP